MVKRFLMAAVCVIAPVSLFGLSVSFSSPAGAAGATSGSVVPGLIPSTTVATPFASGQKIYVDVPANETFSSADTLNNNDEAINILECSAPNGVVPTNLAACDGNTVQGDSIMPNTDGSSTSVYTVYALPDSISLDEGTGGPDCGDTDATECVLYIGNNQTDFTVPHLWSEPFFVQANSDDSGENPGVGTPEIPLVIILPVVGMGLLGVTLLLRRREEARS